MTDNVMVSIVCNTYNHEKYIEQTIISFLMQKTNFKFEVLIHDDASTDNTATVIKRYETLYPEIIKPIYEVENQYSKKNGMIAKLQYGRAKGKYIAVCEGDDFWTDDLKLQKQFNVLENNPDIDMCAHKAVIVDAESEKSIGYIAPKNKEIILPPSKVIEYGGGYIATNSLFYRTSLRKTKFEFFKKISIDYTLQILGSLRGGIYYLPDCMSAYRKLSLGSWTREMDANVLKRVNHTEEIISTLMLCNKETNYQYNESVIAHCVAREISNMKADWKNRNCYRIKIKSLMSSNSCRKKIIILRKVFVLLLKHA